MTIDVHIITKEIKGYGYRKMRRAWEVVRVHTDGTVSNV